MIAAALPPPGVGAALARRARNSSIDCRVIMTHPTIVLASA
jgi:hypothetical protein